ncbi:glycosyltransferase [Pelagicoccus sp. SDUM812003]|uniref:glycosyltransferase n=1 Tax=Pelagicoccus sp. SDUM812003 TaxID=3041267 RepID=UPI00280DDE1D|nr:glycosyltransferase [Pelagicoccus sp. SDUM812003]MDQ8204989.1 glycosyltransferase [Pelagicoccus sp. SDUM812003]
MKIAIVNEHWSAGATRCAKDLQRGLQDRHEVTYFPEERLSQEQQLKQLEKLAPDIVHLHSYYGDQPYSFIEAVAKRYPTVFTPHDPRPIGSTELKCWNCEAYRTCFKCPIIGNPKRYSLIKHNYFWERLEKRRIHNRLPLRTTVVCVSEWMKKRASQTELGRLRLKCIHNGVDSEKFKHDPEARGKLNIPKGNKVLSFIAHHAGWKLDERKGVHILAQALTEHVLPKHPDVIVLAVGGGMIPNIPNVRPIGYASPDTLAKYYSASDIFVAPSLADNLPYTVLEAMACSTPVVASDIGGIPEEIESGITGLTFKTGSAQALGEALLKMLGSPPETLKQMGEKSRQRIEREFSIPRFVAEYEKIYEELVPSVARIGNR